MLRTSVMLAVVEENPPWTLSDRYGVGNFLSSEIVSEVS
jgi:hypothetical protein